MEEEERKVEDAEEKGVDEDGGMEKEERKVEDADERRSTWRWRDGETAVRYKLRLFYANHLRACTRTCTFQLLIY